MCVIPFHASDNRLNTITSVLVYWPLDMKNENEYENTVLTW